MIENQRPYQVMYSKTHNRSISLAVAFGAKLAGIAYCAGLSVFDKEYAPGDRTDIIKKNLERIYQKPAFDEGKYVFKPTDESIDVSLIIPAYNAEHFINCCIDSILEQRTAYSTEIIVVNDNSSDRTLCCLEKYRRHSNVKIIDFKNGGSAASARNEGLKYATGKYVMFADSDDMLLPGSVEALLKEALETDSDIVQGGWQYMSTDGTRGERVRYAEMIYAGENANDRFELPGMPWGKVYKRELFKNICFPRNYTCFEDAVIHFLVFRKAVKVASITENIYLWRKNPAGITATSQSMAKALQSYWIVEDMLETDAMLSLPHNDMFAQCMIGQLSNFCYVNVAKMDKTIQKNIFALCCGLYESYLNDFDYRKMPYAVSLGAKALKKRRFDLWVIQGKYYQLIR